MTSPRIRDAEFRVIGYDVVAHTRRHRLQRADLWPSPDGAGCQIGVTWEDGSTAIWDAPDLLQAQAWARHECPAATTVHEVRA